MPSTMTGMNGMSATTGQTMGGVSHLRQSISDILTTPVGSRVQRRTYGSDLYRLIDAPMNRATLLKIYAAVTEAIVRWEPRFRLTKVVAVHAEPGAVILDLSGDYLPDGRTVTLDGIAVR